MTSQDLNIVGHFTKVKRVYEGKRYITTGLVDFRLRAKESRFLKAPDGARLKTAEYFKSHSIGFYRCQTNYNLSYISILN